jgi:2-oxo-3-hexenedioate decarboxylase
MDAASIHAIASRLIDAQNRATMLPPIAPATLGFDIDAAYDVLHEIESRRIAQGWRPVGRKIGFTNRTLWPRYGVYQPMGARVWSHTVQYAKAGRATQTLAGFVQPRIEPEIVFKLAAPVAAGADAHAVLAATEWIAGSFEIVQSHFPDWRFEAADCTAAFGLHAALTVGEPYPIHAANRDDIVAMLPTFCAKLRRGRVLVDTGVGANVLDSPALAVSHLANVLARYPQHPSLEAGEIVTTGTITDAWPVIPGETWSSDYGELPLRGLTLEFV